MNKLIAIWLVASPLAACGQGGLGDNQQGPQERRIDQAAHFKRIPLEQVYQSTFPKTSPGCCLLDKLPGSPKDLAVGQSNLGETASGDTSSGKLVLTAPATIESTDPPKTPSVGFFRTGLDYGPGTAFAIRATYRNPDGPLAGKAWAVGVTARDGELDDRFDATRLSVTFRVKGGRAALNIGAGADEATRPPAVDIGEMYALIFERHQPFTLEIYVDRKRGFGTASLATAGAETISLRFLMKDFLKDSGPPITTVGAALANCCVPGATVSVELVDFQVWGQKP